MHSWEKREYAGPFPGHRESFSCRTTIKKVMREHLYKAKRLEDSEWVYGSLIHDKSTNEAFITVGRHVKKGTADYFTYEVDPETVCEWTGKHDLKEVKAFEEDIFLDQNGEKWVISWSVVDSAFFAGKFGLEYQKSKRISEMEIAEVMGSKFDRNWTE